MSKDEIMITKKNKKGKIVEVWYKTYDKELWLIRCWREVVTLEATIATGSKANLNTNIFIPKILEILGLDMDPLDVDILRRDLYIVRRWRISYLQCKKEVVIPPLFLYNKMYNV